MNQSERAALTALLDNVGLGFTKCLAETKLLREFLRRTERRVIYKAKSEPVVITLSLGTCAQAPKTPKAPANKAGACNNNRSRAK